SRACALSLIRFLLRRTKEIPDSNVIRNQGKPNDSDAAAGYKSHHPARYSVNRKLDFPELDVKLLLRAIGVYPRVLEQEEQPGLISASRRRPRLNCRYRPALEWSSSAYRRHHTAQYTSFLRVLADRHSDCPDW